MAYSAISSRCSFCKIIKTELGPSRGVEGSVLVAECMDDTTSQLASCHLSKCSKARENELAHSLLSKVNEIGLILARVSI